MKTKKEIKEKIKKLRNERNFAKRFKNTEGFVYLSNGAILALQWMLGYKYPPTYWCHSCAILHNYLKCPKCGNSTPRE